MLGTSPRAIDLAEDRERFGALLRSMGIRQPDHGSARSTEEALEIAERIGYPVLVRPSYVLGGQSMRIFYVPAALEDYLNRSTHVASDRPMLIDMFLEGAFEYDVDAICDGQRVVIAGVLQHVEEAGVHSGDSMAMVPPYRIKPKVLDQMREVTRKLALALEVRGLMNVQFAERDGALYVLEVNPRASRTVPFLAKATAVPFVQHAARVMAGATLDELGLTQDPEPRLYYAKAPVFVFHKFPGVDVLLGPEMHSTGEVMGVGASPGEAFLKAMLGSGVRLPASGTVFLSVNDRDKDNALEVARRLHEMGFALMGTRGTALHLSDQGLPVRLVFKVNQGRPNVADLIRNGQIQMVINTPLGRSSRFDEKAIRLAASEHGVPCITTLSAAESAMDAMLHARKRGLTVRSLQDL